MISRSASNSVTFYARIYFLDRKVFYAQALQRCAMLYIAGGIDASPRGRIADLSMALWHLDMCSTLCRAAILGMRGDDAVTGSPASASKGQAIEFQT